MPKDKRQKRDLHALDGEGMVLCNPRDKRPPTVLKWKASLPIIATP